MATTVMTLERSTIAESEAQFLITPLIRDREKEEERMMMKKKKKKRSSCHDEHKCELIRYDALPDFLKHNEFILDYYRSEWPLKEAIRSIFSVHNETLNIWTHLIGFLLFLSLAILTATMVPTAASTTTNQPLLTNVSNTTTVTGHVNYNGLTAITVAPTADAAATAMTTTRNAIARWPFYAYLGGAMFCLLMSSACHLLSCHSARACYLLLRLDYAGIAALIVTSFYPLVYYSFACDPLARGLYLGLITAVGAAVVAVSLLPAFERPRFRHVRAALFAGMGLSGLVPILHKLAVHGDRPEAMAATAYEMAMGACYAAGVAVYAARVPERWMPGMFDIAGHSHQLFHVLVIAGAYFHYLAGLVYLRWRDVDACYI